MLCCVGLFGGVIVGQSLGGVWTVAAPAIGFGVGLYGDMKFMHRMHRQDSSDGKNKGGMSCCDLASKLGKNKKTFIPSSSIESKEVRSDSG